MPSTEIEHLYLQMTKGFRYHSKIII